MTDTDVDLDTLAQRIAEGGRDGLVARLRSAYADAAAAHADLISLDDERIEAMVQSAAGHADGLQWRRALADVAAEELGVSVTQALTHPAVARAQALVGAPSYEQSLAELIARPVPPPTSERAANAELADDSAGMDAEPADVLPEPEPPTPEPEPEPEPAPPVPEPPASAWRSVSDVDSELPQTVEHQAVAADETAALGDATETADELETVEADDVVLELLPEPDPIEYETEAYDVEATFTEEPPTLEPEPFSAAAIEEEFIQQPGPITAPEPVAEGETQVMPHMAAEPVIEYREEELELVIPAVHQGGVANLPTKREGLGVRLSADGLDILQGDHEIIGRLIWDEIETLEVPNQRSRRRRSEPHARLLVRTPHGDASFDVPGISSDDLRDRVEPIVRLYGRH